MKQNPYSLVFGKEPSQMISRAAQSDHIIDTFSAKIPAQQVYVITGVRGSGKTVLMTKVSKRIAQQKDWIVIELNPERDMLSSLAAKLCSETPLAKIFEVSKINLSFFGLGVEINGVAPITDIEAALTRMLQALAKHGKRVLVTVDEAVNSETMRIFTSAFQIFVRSDLPVFLLMTGLYENVNSLQNEKSLTFLYRAPKIELKPLNIGTIADNYKRNFRLDDDAALDMAKRTKGYSFAFQVLGYFTWEHGGLTDQTLADYKQYLDEYVYEKIWSELSETDRKVAYAIAKVPDGKVSEVRSLLEYNNNQFNPYRQRLIRRGLLNGDTYGYVRFTLPLFERYVLENY